MSRVPGRTSGNADRFPGFDALAQSGHWDSATSAVVLARLGTAPDIRFFTPTEEAIARVLIAQLLDLPDGDEESVVALVDARLKAEQTDGWHYEDMPIDTVAWRETLSHLDSDAHDRFERGVSECRHGEQAALIQQVQDLGAESWHGLGAAHVWSLWTRYACTAFYSHPGAWNEIGFPGPAYPQGYKNPGIDTLEKGEVRDAFPADDPARGRSS